MEIKLLVGLGNPGVEYENTYHNVGQLFVDDLAGESAKFKKEKYFEYQRWRKPILVKTLTFMNQSGVAVLAAKNYFNSKPNEILIIHDDSDISLGGFKLSFGRGSAGHQGIESIIKFLRTNKFYRLRIGIRPMQKAGLPAEVRQRRTKAGKLVLKKIPTSERKVLKNLFRRIRARYPHIDSKANSAFGL